MAFSNISIRDNIFFIFYLSWLIFVVFGEMHNLSERYTIMQYITTWGIDNLLSSQNCGPRDFLVNAGMYLS